MTTDQNRRYAMLVRVRDFGVAHRTRFPANAIASRMFKTVNTSVEQLAAHATSVASGKANTREGVQSKAAARGALRQQLRTISRTARAVSIALPGIEERFRMTGTATDEALVTTARAFAIEARPLADRFVAHGLPKTFVASLNANIEAFDGAVRSHAGARATRVAARAEFRRTLADGVAAVRRLDAIVPNYLAGDEVTLSLWARARHVERSPAAHVDRTPAVTEQPAAVPPPVAAPVAG